MFQTNSIGFRSGELGGNPPMQLCGFPPGSTNFNPLSLIQANIFSETWHLALSITIFLLLKPVDTKKGFKMFPNDSMVVSVFIGSCIKLWPLFITKKHHNNNNY